MEPAQPERAEVDVPFPVIDLGEANPLAAERLTDIDPAGVPADPAVVTHTADLVVARVLEGVELARIGPHSARATCSRSSG